MKVRQLFKNTVFLPEGRALPPLENSEMVCGKNAIGKNFYSYEKFIDWTISEANII